MTTNITRLELQDNFLVAYGRQLPLLGDGQSICATTPGVEYMLTWIPTDNSVNSGEAVVVITTTAFNELLDKINKCL